MSLIPSDKRDYPMRGTNGAVVRNSEQRQWVRFAWIGEHDGAMRVNARHDAADYNGLTVEEINAACNVTIILSRMVRKGRNEWVKRLWDNRPRSRRP